MAKVIVEKEQTVVVQTWQPWVRVIVIGAAIGFVTWVLTSLLSRYVIEPLTCRDIANAAMCLNATPIAGNVAAVLAGLLGTLVLVRMGIARPIILAVASAALLWNVAAWTAGLHWFETILWTVLLYALSYLLFAWIARYARVWVVLVVSLIIVLAIRIALIV